MSRPHTQSHGGRGGQGGPSWPLPGRGGQGTLRSPEASLWHWKWCGYGPKHLEMRRHQRGAQRRGPGLRHGGAWWEEAPKDKDGAARGQSQWPRREAWSWPKAPIRMKAFRLGVSQYGGKSLVPRQAASHLCNARVKILPPGTRWRPAPTPGLCHWTAPRPPGFSFFSSLASFRPLPFFKCARLWPLLLQPRLHPLGALRRGRGLMGERPVPGRWCWGG